MLTARVARACVDGDVGLRFRIERDDPEVRRVNIFLNVAYDAGDSGDEEERAWPSLLLMKHGKVTNMFDKPRTTKNVLRFAQS